MTPRTRRMTRCSSCWPAPTATTTRTSADRTPTTGRWGHLLLSSHYLTLLARCIRREVDNFVDGVTNGADWYPLRQVKMFIHFSKKCKNRNEHGKLEQYLLHNWVTVECVSQVNFCSLSSFRLFRHFVFDFAFSEV